MDGSLIFGRLCQCILPWGHIGATWPIWLNLCFRRPTQVHNLNGKLIGSAVFARREFMVGKICERGGFWARSERERELLVVRVVSWQSWEDVVAAWTVKSESERLEWGCQRELGSWFQRQGEAHWRSDQLYITRMMLTAEWDWQEMKSECCDEVGQRWG